MFCKILVIVFALAFAIQVSFSLNLHICVTTDKLIYSLLNMFVNLQALPQIALRRIEAQNTILTELGLLLTEDDSSVDYNQYILNLESVVEEVQKVALYAIQSAVEIGELVAKTLATLGAQQNVLEINNLQNNFFRMFEDDRHKAFGQG